VGDRPAVVVVGAASRDLDPNDPRGWHLGGTVTYASLAIARLGLRVRTLIGVDDKAASAHELGLLVAAGCEIELARLRNGPVFDNQETPAAGRRQIAHSASDRIPMRELPRAWRNSSAALLGPVAGELGPAWESAFAPKTTVGLAWQGLLRRLVAGQPVGPRPIRPLALIRRADLAIVSAEDVALAGGRTPLRELLPRAGQQLVVSHGAEPAVWMVREQDGVRARLIPVPPVTTLRDTVGAGDVLLGAWLAAAVTTGKADARAVQFGMAAASAKVEAGPLADMPDLRALCERLVKRLD
jgi:sugar/nucleoside kinase (ribokinase family)